MYAACVNEPLLQLVILKAFLHGLNLKYQSYSSEYYWIRWAAKMQLIWALWHVC